MNISKPLNSSAMIDEIRQLQQSKRTLILGTVSSEGAPDASYAPYVFHEGSFYIFVSRLAKHTGNLLSAGRCHTLILEDERDSVNLFARRRLGLHCQVIEIDRNLESAIQRIDQFEAAFGPVIDTLRGLPDFHLLELRPLTGTFVKGFGQAFPVDGRLLG